jgi:tetratricopeptide (TPR) repeat protein
MRSSPRRFARVAAALLAASSLGAAAADIDALWEYDDPAASETRFRAAIVTASGDDRLELLTQVARTDSLRGRFAEAHRVLDEVARELPHAKGPRPRLRYLLERGRTWNSAHEAAHARPLFIEAWEAAREANEEGLAVDAAHMVAITGSGTEQGLEWNRRGLALANASRDAKARSLIPAMLNNSAWDLQALGRREEALSTFEAAERAWSARGGARQVAIAKWSVAYCLRSLDRPRAALVILAPLASARASDTQLRRDVLEEIALDALAVAGLGVAR